MELNFWHQHIWYLRSRDSRSYSDFASQFTYLNRIDLSMPVVNYRLHEKKCTQTKQRFLLRTFEIFFMNILYEFDYPCNENYSSESYLLLTINDIERT